MSRKAGLVSVAVRIWEAHRLVPRPIFALGFLLFVRCCLGIFCGHITWLPLVLDTSGTVPG